MDGKKEISSVGQTVIAEDDEEPETAEDGGTPLFTVTLPTFIFQFTMLFASLYFGMLFTNWGDIDAKASDTELFYRPEFTFVIKVTAQMFTIALFTVSFTLNLCCPDRVL